MRSRPPDPLSRNRNTSAQARKMVAGTMMALSPSGMTSRAMSKLRGGFGKEDQQQEFHPTMEICCSAAGMIQPVEPNCGFEDAIESTPKRMQIGTAASATISMPIMLPAKRRQSPGRSRGNSRYIRR